MFNIGHIKNVCLEILLALQFSRRTRFIGLRHLVESIQLYEAYFISNSLILRHFNIKVAAFQTLLFFTMV